MLALHAQEYLTSGAGHLQWKQRYSVVFLLKGVSIMILRSFSISTRGAGGGGGGGTFCCIIWATSAMMLLSCCGVSDDAGRDIVACCDVDNNWETCLSILLSVCLISMSACIC